MNKNRKISCVTKRRGFHADKQARNARLHNTEDGSELGRLLSRNLVAYPGRIVLEREKKGAQACNVLARRGTCRRFQEDGVTRRRRDREITELTYTLPDSGVR